jgi:hypothetical protein
MKDTIQIYSWNRKQEISLKRYSAKVKLVHLHMLVLSVSGKVYRNVA